MSFFDRAVRALHRTLSYRRRFGWRATWQRLGHEWRRRRSRVSGPLALPGQAGASPLPGLGHAPTAAEWVQARFPGLTPIRTYRLPPHGRRRLTVVTDSIGKGSLFGGVGTALILATQLANRLDADLRIVTRTEPPVPAGLAHVLDVYGLALKRESQFRFVPANDAGLEIDLLADELVLTTSWWTTVAALPGVGPASLVYLVQEDERMFYAFGDERLRCEQLLQRRDLRLVVNTRLLLEHFVAEGMTHFRQQALSFEPAFPERVFRPRPRAPGTRRRFVFYARPNNARNLFFLGIEVIDAALIAGVMDPHEWEIVFVGKDIPDVVLGDGYRPQRLENLDWADYAALIGGADLGLCLMSTPHPSYPPLDMAASGAVVVTNRFGVKRDLSAWSPDILLCDATCGALVTGLREGVSRLLTRRPEAMIRSSALSRDWSQALAEVVEQLIPAATGESTCS